MKFRHASILAVLTLGLAISACEKKDEGVMDEAADAIGDATNTRDGEEFKDAGEDASDAMENAVEGAKEAVGADEK
tara:strand:+ start:1757 stop:1984 length:228 start_codon:yes stop_codon:yes gene_type:complete